MKAEIKPRITLEGRTPLQTVIPLSEPYLVFLDPSDICNAHCPHCPTGSGEAKKYRKPQLMEWDLYKKIIDDLCDMPEPIKTLRLYMMGEPLLNPRFADMVEYAKSKVRFGVPRFGQIDSTTNGSLLTFAKSQEIIASGLDKIFISVPKSYDRLYVQRIAHLSFVEYRRLKIHIKIIGDGLEEGQIENFLFDFSPFADSISVEHLSPCWPNFDIGKVGDVGIYGQPLHEVQVCPYIFYSLAINSDGTISLCFLDWKKDMVIGDLKKESFKDVWNGITLRNERIMQLAGGRKLLRNCENCRQLKYGQADDIDRYAQEILGRLQ